MRQADLRALEAFDAVLTRIDDQESFGSAVLAPISMLVPCDYVTYNEIDVRRRKAFAAVEPFNALDGADYAAFQRYVGQHPVVAYSRRTGDGSAHMISDFFDRRSFHRTDLYATFFRDAQAEHQAAITIAYTRSLVVGIAFNRARRDFTGRERLLLNLIRSHLVVAHRGLARVTDRNRFISALEAGLSDHGLGVILVTPTGHLAEASDEARRILLMHRGITLSPGAALPASIVSFIAGSPSRAKTLCLEGQESQLYLRYLGDNEDDNCIVAVEARSGPEPPPIAGANLTSREQEVLAMVSSSKNNSQIAAELGVSVRTVHKHLEHIYAKLDVSDRTSAAARWLSERNR